jgi:hypothetical protein
MWRSTTFRTWWGMRTNVTETAYRKEPRPVLTRGARAMDAIFEVGPDD